MGRPPLGDAARNVLVTVRLTAEEAARWDARTTELDTTRAEYVRSLVEKDLAKAAKKGKR